MKLIRKLAGSIIVLALLTAFFLDISKPPVERVQGGLLDKEVEAVKDLERFKAAGSSLENERFRLALDGKYGSVTVEDKITGTRWSSLPEEAAVRTLPGNNKRFVRSPVLVRYSEGKEIVQTYPFKEQGTLTVKPQADGVRLNYNMTKIGIAFSLILKLRADGMEVTIPYDSVKEGSQFRLVSIEPFPFFDAASEKEQGAVVLPDGSGALMTFTEQHPKYFETFSQVVYGGDYAFRNKVLEKVSSNPQENVSYWPQEYAALPVFGLYRENRSFIGIITQGDHDAKINATPSGLRNIRLYRTSAEFVYRNDDLVNLAGAGEVPLLESRLIGGERQVRYVLLDRNQPGYVGMAEAYRSYLIQEKGLKPVKADAVPYQLRLLGGALQGEVIGSSFVPVTTFQQARQIIDELLKQGITELEVTYDGWSSDGIYGDQPKHFPAASKLGGNDELKKLAVYAKEKHVRLYLKTNYVRVPASGDVFKPASEAIRGLNKEIMKSYDPRRSTRQPRGGAFYFVRPDKAYDKYISKEASRLAEDGIAGVDLGNMGNMLYSDPGSKQALSRQYTLDTWVKSLDLMRKSVGSTAVDYGFGYVLGHVDRIDNVPLDSSHYMYADRTIPFYQIAVHGLIPYTSAPLNFSDDPRTDFLRSIEYGASPSFYLTHDNPSKLQRTRVDYMVSSVYTDWLRTSAEMYRRAAEALTQVAGHTMTAHQQLGAELYRTTYSNGTQIIVNYGDEAASAAGVSVPAADFTVVPGKEGTE